MIALIIKCVIAYLLGSVSGSLLLGKLKGVDIRGQGSGNAGGTNAFRTQGLIFALMVVLVDVGKSALAVWWLPDWAIPGIADTVGPYMTALCCGFAAVVGHCYPVFHGFKGGKGAATAVGALAVISPVLLIPLLITWLVVLVLTGYVGLATMLAGISLVPSIIFTDGNQPLLIFGVALAVFLVFTHRSNIQRMRQGVEHRFEKARIRNWFGD